jgi:hypothetical protein
MWGKFFKNYYFFEFLVVHGELARVSIEIYLGGIP